VGRNFLAANRDQQYLMPPSLSDWLAEDHLAWFLLDVVDGLDLSELYAAYRADGWGRAAHDPSMMLALLLYAYCLGERSSRRIEVRCREDVAFRVITANSFPDHATIARFRAQTICRMNVSLPLAVLSHHRLEATAPPLLRRQTAPAQPGAAGLDRLLPARGVGPSLPIPAHDRLASGLRMAATQTQSARFELVGR
jgi:Transposase domain (DUF772)